MPIKLGSKVRDVYTGFTGTALARTKHLYGCSRILIEPTELKEDGSRAEPQGFDEQRIEFVEHGPQGDINVEKSKLSLGSKAKDKVTGFEGVIVSITEWLYGCPRIGIEPTKLKKGGGLIEAEGFDEPRIEVTEERKPEVTRDSRSGRSGEKDPPGGPYPDPSFRSDPTK